MSKVILTRYLYIFDEVALAFIQYYSDLLKEYLLYETFIEYIQCPPKERNKNIINIINNILFLI